MNTAYSVHVGSSKEQYLAFPSNLADNKGRASQRRQRSRCWEEGVVDCCKRVLNTLKQDRCHISAKHERPSMLLACTVAYRHSIG